MLLHNENDHSCEMTKQRLLLGYGNTLREDDGLGPFIVSNLANQNLAACNFLACHQLLPEHAECINASDEIYFVDAATNLAEPYSIARVIPTTISEAHALTPSGLLTLCAAIFQYRPNAWLISVQGECFGFGEELSDQGRKNALLVIEYLRERLSN